MAKSNKDDIVNGILEYKLIESAVKLSSAAKEDAKRNGVKSEPPGANIIRAFATPDPLPIQRVLRWAFIALVIVMCFAFISCCSTL